MSAAAEEAPPPPPGAAPAAAAQGGDAQEHHAFANPTAASAAPRTSLLGPLPPLRPPRVLTLHAKTPMPTRSRPVGAHRSVLWQLFFCCCRACPFFPFLPNEPSH